MGVYLTPTGFQRRTLQEIRLDLEQGLRDLFGPEIDTRPEGRVGHWIGLAAKALSDGWEGTGEIITVLDPSQAEGVFLDLVCSLIGVYRIAAAKTLADCACYVSDANDGLLIPAGRQVRRTRGALVFSLRDATTVSSAACRDVYLQAPGIVPGQVVSLELSFGTFSVTVPSTSTPLLSTYQLLATAINASSWGGEAQAYSATTVPAGAQVAEECLRLIDTQANFGVTKNAPWEMVLVGSFGTFEAAVYGEETVAFGEISEISTPEPGWDAVYNLVEAIPGRLAETDSALRIRREQLFGTGNATERAILNALYNRVDGIISASIRSNRTMLTDADGRPPKSFEVIVQGGAPAQIGQVIWDTEPAGIEPHGNQTVSLVDSQGYTQSVKFTRPLEKWLWVDFKYLKYNEEQFPTDGESQIRAALLEWAASELKPDTDVFPDRIKAAAYRAITGLGELQAWVQLTDVGGTPGAYVRTPLVVGLREVARLSGARLTVSEGGFL